MTVENSFRFRSSSIFFTVSPLNFPLPVFFDFEKSLFHDQIVKVQQLIESWFDEPTFSPLFTHLALLSVYVERISEHSRFWFRNFLQKESKVDQSIVRCPHVYFHPSFFFFFYLFLLVDFLFLASFTFGCLLFAYISFLCLRLPYLSLFEHSLISISVLCLSFAVKIAAFLINAFEPQLNYSSHATNGHCVIILCHYFVFDQCMLKIQLRMLFEIFKLLWDGLNCFLSENCWLAWVESPLNWKLSV